LAVIPSEEFGVIEAWHASEGNHEKWHAAVTLRAAARSRFGWEGESREDSEFDSATTADASNVAKHRYLTVIQSEL